MDPRNVFLTAIALLLFLSNAHARASPNATYNSRPALDPSSGPARLMGLVGVTDRPLDAIGVEYQVSLHDGIRDLCGAVILDDLYLLASAHCVVREKGPHPGPLYVLIGFSRYIGPRATAANVETMYVPASFDGGRGAKQPNDIAVLKLSKKLELHYRSHVSPAELPHPLVDHIYDNYENITAWMFGFESENLAAYPESIFSKRPLLGEAVVLNNVECERAWQGRAQIYATQICARLRNVRQTVCTDDSGSTGLSYRGTIIGVSSFGHEFCYVGTPPMEQPAVFTRVSAYAQFIRDAMADRPVAGIVNSYPVADYWIGNSATGVNDPVVVLLKSFFMLVTVVVLTG